MIIQIRTSPGEVRAVALQDGVVMDYALSRPGRPDGMGDVHRGRVIARVPAMAGAFVALVDGEGFLPDSAGATGLTVGDAVRVRITRAAQGDKGPRLARDGPCDPGPPTLLRRGLDAGQRLATLYPGAALQPDDSAQLMTRFTDAVEAELDVLATPHADLPGGMQASFTPTPALVAIDLDMAAATAGQGGKPAAQLAANRAALPALARHIRLRNLSGAIVLDLAGLKASKRAALAPALTEALAQDPLRPRFLGFTALGLAEILRPRTHPPLHELLGSPHAAGLRALRTMVHDMAADPASALALRAPPAICTALEQDSAARADLARRTGRPLVLRADPALAPGQTVLERIARA